MKASAKILLALCAFFVVTQARAMRWYSPNTGCWFSRDPIGEPGFELNRQQQAAPVAAGPNLYGFVVNAPLNAIDPLGLVIVGFYGADVSYRWPNAGNELLERLSGAMESHEKVLRPSSQWRTYPLYYSRADSQAFSDLLRYLDTNNVVLPKNPTSG